MWLTNAQMSTQAWSFAWQLIQPQKVVRSKHAYKGDRLLYLVFGSWLCLWLTEVKMCNSSKHLGALVALIIQICGNSCSSRWSADG